MKFCWILLFLGGALVPAAASLKVISSTASQLTFEWDLSVLDTAAVSTGTGKFTALSFPEENIMIGEAGEPRIPGYSVFAGMPGPGAVSVALEPLETKSIKLANPIFPVPGQRLKRHPDLHFVNPWISSPQYTSFRLNPACHLVIKPFICGSDSRSVTMLEKAQCTITFPPAGNSLSVANYGPVYTSMIKGLLLNYDLAKNWSVPAKRGLGKTISATFPLSFDTTVYSFPIGDGHGGFNEATVNENRIMKISGSRLISLFGKNVAIGRIALYASFKGELPLDVPTFDSIPDGVSEVPLLRVDRNGNGFVDTNDYCLAYVTGSSDWAYDPGSQSFKFNLDRVDDYRHYYLTLKKSGGALSITKRNPLQAGGDTLRSIDNKVRFKKSLKIQPAEEETGLDWIWQELTAKSNTLNFQMTALPNLDSTRPGTIRVMDTVLTSTTSEGWTPTMAVSFGGASLCNGCSTNTLYPVSRWNDLSMQVSIVPPSDTGNEVDMQCVDVGYEEKLDVSAAGANILGLDTNHTPHWYQVSGVSDKLVYIFGIPADESGIQLIDTVRGSSSGSSYSWADTAQGMKYFICDDSALMDLPQTLSNTWTHDNGMYAGDLRNANQTDFLIISYGDFLTQAQRLAQDKVSMGFKNPRVVDIANVYDYFSGGNVDPTAIRNFLLYVQNYWTNGDKLDFVVLFGNGNYDIKQLGTAEKDFIPTAQLWSECVDDFYSYLSPGDPALQYDPQYFLGRLPAMNAADANAVVDKIEEMENVSQADFGAWRNRALFVNDDDQQGANLDPLGFDHLNASEDVVSLVRACWPSVDMRIVNLFEYPWTSNWEKPEASQAMINQINSGVGYWNWFGHGADDVIADEHIFALQNNDIQKLYNEKQYPVFTAFSCSVGRFDKPDADCISDRLVRAPHAGAIAAISSTRLAYADVNENMAKTFYAVVLDSTVSSNCLGRAYQLSKDQNYSPYLRAYALLGDPSMQMVNLQRKVTVNAFSSSNVPIDTLMALQKIKIQGEVLSANGSVDGQFGAGKTAYVNISLINPDDTTGRKDGAPRPVSYPLPGSPLFTGVTQVHNGMFEQDVLLPRNVAFLKQGVRLAVYAWQDSVAGTGYNGNIIFKGTAIDSTTDTTGPRITIYPVYDDTVDYSTASFSDKITSTLPLSCRIVVTDPSGIDVVGTGPDEGLNYEIPGALSKRNINSTFQYDNGDYRKGSATVTFEENSLSTGTYTLSVSAKDLLGHRTVSNFSLVITSGDLSLDHVFNFPNPMVMRKSTKFYFYSSVTQTNGQDIPNYTVKIYALNGKPVRVIRFARNGEPWDGTDQTGMALSPSVYLYQVTAEETSQQGKTVKSPIEKLIILPPR